MSTPQKCLLDENIPEPLQRFLKSRGWRAVYVPKGISNGRAAILAKTKKHMFLTRDTDFLDDKLFPPKDFFGVVTSSHP